MQAASPLGPAAPVPERGRRGPGEGEVERLSVHLELPNLAKRLGKLRRKLGVLDWSAGCGSESVPSEAGSAHSWSRGGWGWAGRRQLHTF